MKLAPWTYAVVLASTTALADGTPVMSVQEEAQALIGKEYPSRIQDQRILPEFSCIHEGGGMMHLNGADHDDWAFSTFNCQGRMVEVLKRIAGKADGATTWRIVDTLVLPRHEKFFDHRHPNALYLFSTGSCELDGRTDTYFIALVRFGKRERIDWRTGVKKAWTYDIERGRIMPLSTRRVVCYRPEPD